MSSVPVYLSVGGLLLFGTTTSLFAKIVYELTGIGRNGELKNFEKPWAMTCIMFLGMSLCLPLAYYQQSQAGKAKRARTDAEQPLMNGGEEKKGTGELRTILLLGIPTAFDLTATVLMNIGLLSVTASVYQMMRGAEMLFAAVFSVVFLHRKLNRLHLLGILCCVTGITLVGVSSLLAGEGSASHQVSQWQMLAGMMLIVLSQAVQAAQITFEDFFLSSMDVPALKIVGFEGLWGAGVMLLVLLPIVQRLPGKDGGGLHEDSVDTLHMITHSKAILYILLIDMAALLMYNVSGMCVTGQLGAVFRTVLETMRTLFVWLVDLLLFYTALGGGTLGESWSVYSYIQALGFLVLVCGTLVYGRGDEHEQKIEHEALIQEALRLGSDGPPSSSGPPAAAAPMLARASGAIRTAPMAMTTPSSFKSTMNISSYTQRGSLAGGGGSYMANQVGANDNYPDMSAPQ